jgi:uncharacterized damage-inducible protein DinB
VRAARKPLNLNNGNRMQTTPFDPVACLRSAISGTGVHIDPKFVLDGIDWKTAGAKPQGAPHSIFQLVNHLVYWRNLYLSGMTQSQMSGPPTAADGWPGAPSPASAEAWDAAVAMFTSGHHDVLTAIDADDPLAGVPAHEPTKRANVITTIAIHTSYHVGQIVLLRRQLESWPPPQGEHTW